MRPLAFARPSDADEAVRAVAGDPEAVFLAGGNAFKIPLAARTIAATLRQLTPEV